jgi:Fe-S cluster assembly protein SufD
MRTDISLPSIMSAAGERHQIVFFNGRWQPELSRLGELADIITGNEKTGYRLVLAGQTCLVTAPVELVFVTEAETQPLEIDFNLTVELGASGRLTLIEHHIQSRGAQNVVASYTTNIQLGAQAKLVHGKVVDVGAFMSVLSDTHVTIAEGAYYDNFKLIKSGKLLRNEIVARLAGKLAQCALNGVMLLRGATHADTTTHIIHEAPFGSSRETYKSVIADKARGVFQGRITVAEGAQKSDAQQQSRALLLSDQAEADAKPELKIYADDVKCSHGTAIGALDENALFYLRARGLSEKAARGLLIRGFAEEIMDEIHVPEWRDYCRKQAEVWCDEQN